MSDFERPKPTVSVVSKEPVAFGQTSGYSKTAGEAKTSEKPAAAVLPVEFKTEKGINALTCAVLAVIFDILFIQANCPKLARQYTSAHCLAINYCKKIRKQIQKANPKKLQ